MKYSYRLNLIAAIYFVSSLYASAPICNMIRASCIGVISPESNQHLIVYPSNRYLSTLCCISVQLLIFISNEYTYPICVYCAHCPWF